ncbi:MAG: YkgJ family cysteine cluster protein [bacterium]
MITSELKGLAFRCLDDCGFCCTFTPEVAHDELSRLRAKFPELPIARDAPQAPLHIAFQGGCGACTLLARRKCTAYEDRPAHCRYFPFHVYFGRRTEVYVNRSCRGVGPVEGGDLGGAFQQQVLDVAKPHQFAEHERLAARVHRDFERKARASDAMGEVDREIARSLGDSNLWRQASSPDEWATALAPFAEEDVVARPFYLAADLQWLTFETVAAGRLQPKRMQEDGSLADAADVLEVRPPVLAPDLVAGLDALLRRLASRDLFAGTVFDAVDGMFYEFTVAAAAAERVTQVAADLLVRAAILRGLGVADVVLVDEVERFYDCAFLDAPTIGGWL